MLMELLSDDYSLIVEVASEELLPENFKGFTFLTDDSRNFVEIKIPSTWTKDVEYFLEGKYSKLSEELKLLIQQHSNLAYMVEKDNLFYTDVRLLALTKSKELENKIVETLYDEKDQHRGADFLKDVEFLPAPGEEHIFDCNFSDLKIKTL